MLFLALVLAAAANVPAAPDKATGAVIVGRWLHAVHPKRQTVSTTAALVRTSNEDGIPGKTQEWLTTVGQYRGHCAREFDDAEVLVTPAIAVRRDWNGFLRKLEGAELLRLKTAIFEAQALALGPPEFMTRGAVAESDDHAFFLLTVTPPGGLPMTWWLNATTGLPDRSVRPGNDSEVTTKYEDWHDVGGMLAPQRARVSETDKPDYQWERASLEILGRAPDGTFAPLTPGASDVRMDASVPAIPFTLEANHIVFKVALNGREPIPFLLDTGADQEYVNEPRLADFGLTVYARSTTTGGGNAAPYGFARGASFRLPGVELKDQHVAVLDQTGLERALGVPLGGILGYDFISRFVVEIDYEKSELKLHDPAAWSYSGRGAIVPVTFDGGIPFAGGAIAVQTEPDIQARFVLDFGAAETMTLTSPFVKANDLARLAGTNASVNRPAGMEKEFFAQRNTRGRVDELRLGPLVARAIPVNFSANTSGAYASATFAGTIGQGIFTRYHVFLDYARNRMIFEPTARSDAPFPEKQTYGLSLLASGADLRTFTVSAVRPGSPAEADGFKKGDVIAAFDGVPAARLTLAELRDRLSLPHAGEHHELQVARGGEPLQIAIELRLVSIDR